MPEGWAEVGARSCVRCLPGCDCGSLEVPTVVASTLMGPDPGGVPSWGLAGGASTVGPGSVSMGPSGVSRGDFCPAGSDGGVPAGGGRADVPIAGASPPGPARGVRTAGATPGSAKPTACCSPGRAPMSGAPAARLTAAWAGVGFGAGRPGRGRKGSATEGGHSEGGAGPGPRPGVKTRRAPFPVGLPRLVGPGQAVRVPVCGHEVCARVWGRWRPLQRRGVRQGHCGRYGRRGCSRARQLGGRESKRNAHVLHRGARTISVPPRRYTGRPSGKHHLMGQRAHRAVHHGYPGRRHSNWVRRSEPVHNLGSAKHTGGGRRREGAGGSGLVNVSRGIGRHPCPMELSPWLWTGARAFHSPPRR